MLKIEQLDQYYGQSHTLRGLNLEVPQQACTVIMGRNGVGKSTLLQCVMGIQKTRGGRIEFKGEDLTRLPVEKRPQLGLGYVPQGRQIFPLLSVQENIEIGLSMRQRGDRKVPDFIFDLFPVLKSMLKRRGGDLSGGQQQQLAIARALVVNPSLLILDEPTEGIQPNVVQEIGDIIRRLNRELGMTVLLVEQKLPFARKLADQFCLLDRGQTVATGQIDQLNDELVQTYLTV